jgi:hypothetical protein
MKNIEIKEVAPNNAISISELKPGDFFKLQNEDMFFIKCTSGDGRNYYVEIDTYDGAHLYTDKLDITKQQSKVIPLKVTLQWQPR